MPLQRRRIRIDAKIIRIGPLEAVDVVFLQALDRNGVTGNVAARGISADAVHLRQAPVVIEPARVRIVGEVTDGGIELPVR